MKVFVSKFQIEKIKIIAKKSPQLIIDMETGEILG